MGLHKFVWDGRKRLQRTDEYQRKVQNIRTSVQAQWQDRLAGSGLLKRWFLRLAMQREIQRKIRQLAPSDALYLVQAQRPKHDHDRSAQDRD